MIVAMPGVSSLATAMKTNTTETIRHRRGDGADLHAHVARQVEPVRLDGDVEGEHAVLR
jgi:hypothetical protein